VTLRRVLIIGISGAGKSTFARRFGAITQLPVIHLDREFWQPDWRPTALQAWRNRVLELAAQPAWIMDGNYSGTLGLRLPRADTVIWFDYPRRKVFPRLARRIIGSYGIARPDMADGCPERIDPEFLRWVWEFPSKSRPQIVAALQAYAPQLAPIVFRRDKDVIDFMRSANLVQSKPSTLVQ
jgi:adenylate kinase family enzyme